MSPLRITAFALVAVGILSLLHGGFCYARDSKSTDIEPLRLPSYERSYQHVPIWTGVPSTIGGVALAMRETTSILSA